jgi:hypothetical protein
MFSGGITGRVATLIIPEVLIGEILQYIFRTLFLAPTCADAQVFFAQKSARTLHFPGLLV